MTKCEQTITQTLSADGSIITICINVHLPFSLARAAAGGPCCGCHCSRAHSGGGDVGGVGGGGVVGGSAPSGCASQGTNTDSQLTVAGGVSAELGISEGGVGGSAPSGCASQGTSTDSQLTVAGSVSAELGISVGGVGGSAPSGHASQETSADSQLTVAGGVSAELGTSEGVVGMDGAGGLETTADSEQIDSQETHVVSDSWQHLWDADLSTISPNQSPVLLQQTGKTARNETSSLSQSPVLQRSTGKTARNETSSPSQSPVLLLHAGRAGVRRGVVSDVFSEPRGGSLVGSGAASEDSIGGVKPAVVATAAQSPASSMAPGGSAEGKEPAVVATATQTPASTPTSSMVAEDSTGGGIVATAAQTPASTPTSSMAPGGSTGGMETSSPATVPPTATGLARAIIDNNILVLVEDPSYLTGLNAQLLTGVPQNARDALDMAGKLPLALKANAIGIPPHELNIDPAQAGGLLGKFDAIISASGGVPGAAGVGGVEIKGARSYRGHKTFQLSRLRAGTPFEHLLLVVRSRNPTDWTDLVQLDNLFWLGHVPRAAFDRAMADRFGRSPPDEVKANVTIASRRNSWLGPHIQWVQFKNLTRSWWNTNVRGVL